MEIANKQLQAYTNLYQHPSALPEAVTSLLKLKIGLLPVVGSAINELLFDLPARIQQNRINEFVNILAEKINAIDHEKINRQYLHSEEFFDLSQKIFDAVSKANNEPKRRALASIYLSAMISSTLNFDEQMIFTDFVNSLRTAQVHILRFVNTKSEELIEIGTYEKYYGKFQEYCPAQITDKFEFRYYNVDLESKSLITMEGGLDNFDSKSSVQAWADHKDPSVRLTTMGQKFIQYLIE